MKHLVLQVNVKLEKAKKSPSTFYYDEEMYSHSNEAMKAWADKYNHDYILIEESRYSHPCFDRFRMFDEIYDKYDCILYADSDFFFHQATPNILEWVQHRDEEVFLTLNTTSNTESNRKDKLRCDTAYYYNSGFQIWKKEARQRFRDEIDSHILKFAKSLHKDQDALNYMLRNNQHIVLQLNQHWNDTMAHVRPLFATHWCGRGKERYSRQHQRNIDLRKMSAIYDLADSIDKYYLPMPLQKQLF